MYCYIHCPQPCSRPPPTHVSDGDSWTLPGKSGLVSCGITDPFSWVLVHTGSVWVLQESISQCCVSSGCSMWGKWGPPPRGIMPYPSLLHPSLHPSLPYPSLLHPSLRQSTADPFGDSQTQFSLSLCGVSGSWYAQGVWALWMSLVGMEFVSKHEFALPTFFLGLLLCPWMWGISSRLLQHCTAPAPDLSSCWGFSDLGCGVSPHGCCSTMQLELIELNIKKPNNPIKK